MADQLGIAEIVEHEGLLGREPIGPLQRAARVGPVAGLVERAAAHQLQRPFGLRLVAVAADRDRMAEGVGGLGLAAHRAIDFAEPHPVGRPRPRRASRRKRLGERGSRSPPSSRMRMRWSRTVTRTDRPRRRWRARARRAVPCPAARAIRRRPSRPRYCRARARWRGARTSRRAGSRPATGDRATGERAILPCRHRRRRSRRDRAVRLDQIAGGND